MAEYRSKYTGAEVDALLDKIAEDNVGDIDSALSTESENPVMNKVITEELNKIPFEKGDTENSAVLKGGDNQTTSANEVALGKYNKSNSSTCLSVGIGTSDTDRKNAFEVTKSGQIYLDQIFDREEDISLNRYFTEWRHLHVYTVHMDFNNITDDDVEQLQRVASRSKVGWIELIDTSSTKSYKGRLLYNDEYEIYNLYDIHIEPIDRNDCYYRIRRSNRYGNIKFSIEPKEDIISMTSISYAALKALRDGSRLISGKQYRITDFVTTTSQGNTQSAGHQFDIIVTADDEKTLNEEARACLHEGDTYFTENGANLSAWKIWYCLDNDSTRFAWADAENGKGVIYRLIDEWGNDCPYDFKSILFKKEVDGEETYIPTFADDLAGGSMANQMMPCIKMGKAELSFNTIGEYCFQNFFDFGASHNHLVGYVGKCFFGKDANHNTLSMDCNSISLGVRVNNCSFYAETANVRVGDGSAYISCDEMLSYVDIGINCRSIYFEVGAYLATIVSGVTDLNFHVNVDRCSVITKGSYKGKEPSIAENVFIGLDSNGNLVAKNIFD